MPRVRRRRTSLRQSLICSACKSRAVPSGACCRKRQLTRAQSIDLLPDRTVSQSLMKLPFINQRTMILVLMLSIIVLYWIGVRPGVHAQEKLPVASGHVNDFAAVLDTASKDRLEQILINLKERTGIDFVIATVKSTGSEQIYDYS